MPPMTYSRREWENPKPGKHELSSNTGGIAALYDNMTDFTVNPDEWLDEFEKVTFVLPQRFSYALKWYAKEIYGRECDVEFLLNELLRELSRETDVSITKAAKLARFYETLQDQKEELLQQHAVEEDEKKKEEIEIKLRVLQSKLHPRL